MDLQLLILVRILPYAYDTIICADEQRPGEKLLRESRVVTRPPVGVWKLFVRVPVGRCHVDTYSLLSATYSTCHGHVRQTSSSVRQIVDYQNKCWSIHQRLIIASVTPRTTSQHHSRTTSHCQSTHYYPLSFTQCWLHHSTSHALRACISCAPVLWSRTATKKSTGKYCQTSQFEMKTFSVSRLLRKFLLR